METNQPNYMNLVFDGTNFRGYLSESELITKAYVNDWAAAITSDVFAEENESYLLEKSDLIRTEGFDENLRLYGRKEIIGLNVNMVSIVIGKCNNIRNFFTINFLYFILNLFNIKYN